MGVTFNPFTGQFDLTGSSGGGGAVDSVNGQTGVVVLDADDVDAANKTLSNLDSPTAVNRDILPDITDDKNLGSDELFFGSSYAFGQRGFRHWIYNSDTGADFATATRSGVLTANDGTTLPSGATPDGVVLRADETQAISIYTIDQTTENSAPIYIQTGNSSSGIRANIILEAEEIDANSTPIINVPNPVNAQDVATKNYVDTADATLANRTLSNLTSPTSINQHLLPSVDNVRNLGDATHSWNTIDVGIISYNGDQKISINSSALLGNSGGLSLDFGNREMYDSGGQFKMEWETAGQVNFGGANRLTNVVDPVDPQDVATKNYVDTTGFTKYTQTFVIADWTLSSPDYLLTIPEATHLKGLFPMIQVFQSNGGTNELVNVTTLMDAATGDVVLSVTETPDNRFDGVVIII